MPVSDPWLQYADEVAAMRRQHTNAVAAGDTAKASQVLADIAAHLATVIPAQASPSDENEDYIPVRRASDGAIYEIPASALSGGSSAGSASRIWMGV